MSNNQLQNAGKDVAYYCLSAERAKLPIKRLDIVKKILRGEGKGFDKISESASTVLSENFAYKITEIPRKKGHYILTSDINLEGFEEYASEYDTDSAKHALLMSILGHILMNRDSAVEEKLFGFLEQLGIRRGQKHKVFGDIEKFIVDEYIKKLYLDCTKCVDRDPPVTEYKWGYRSFREISQMQVLQFVCDVYGNGMKPEDWTDIYKNIKSRQRRQHQRDSE